MNGDTLKWPLYLQLAVFAINLTSHATTKMPPLLIFHAAYATTIDMINRGPPEDAVRDELKRISRALGERLTTNPAEEEVPKDLLWPPDATFQLPTDILNQGLDIHMTYESLHLAATVGTHVDSSFTLAYI